MRDGKKHASRMKELQEKMQWFLRKGWKPPEGDPYSYVTAPLRRGPKGRSGAATAEIEDDSFRCFRPRAGR